MNINYKKLAPKTSYDKNFTKPWDKDEYIYIDGKPFVYTGSWIESLLVRYPGGGCDYADVLLRSLGPDRVKMPYKIRLN